MSRNFGLSFEKVTTGPALRGNEQLARHHVAQQTQRDSNVIQFAGKHPQPTEGWRNLGRGDETPPSFIHDDREFAATCFVAGLAIVPGFFLVGLIFFGLTLFG